MGSEQFWGDFRREVLLELATSPLLERVRWLSLYEKGLKPHLDEEVLEAFRRSPLGGEPARTK